MEKFEKFEIQNQEVIFGGKLKPTTYSNEGGGGGDDMWDTERRRIIYDD